jgi:hypothetical protein
VTNEDFGARCKVALTHGIGVGLALLIEDLILYDHLHGPDDDPILDLLPYTAGVSTILLGFTATKAVEQDLVSAVEAWIVSLCAGTAITTVRAIRKRYQTARRAIAMRHEIAGHAAGGRIALDQADEEPGAGD